MALIKTTRFIPKSRSRCQFKVVGQFRSYIRYQPGHGQFFVPENLRILPDTYIDFRTFISSNGKQYFMFSETDAVETARLTSKQYSDELKQAEARRKGIAHVSFSLPDFNQFIMNQQNNSILPPPTIVKNTLSSENFIRYFTAFAVDIRPVVNQKNIAPIRRGVIVDLETIRNTR